MATTRDPNQPDERRSLARQILINLMSNWLSEFLKNFFLVALPYIYSFQLFGLPAEYYAYGSLQSFALCFAVVSPIISNRAFADTPGGGRPAQIAYVVRYSLRMSLIFVLLALAGAALSFYFTEIMVFK